MGFLRYANAVVAKPVVSIDAWDTLIQGSVGHNDNAGQKFASQVQIEEYDPAKYLLTHCTIVASVDTMDSSAPLGQHFEDGFQVNRKYSDWLVTPKTVPYFNNNFDSWERKLLLSAYKTFIGGQNYCFVPGTEIVMADGTHKCINDVTIGDVVLTHKGRARKVLRTFQHTVDEELSTLYFDRNKHPVKCTSEHPFRVLHVKCPVSKIREGSNSKSVMRYRKDVIRQTLRDGIGPYRDSLTVSREWLSAKDLGVGTLVLGPESRRNSTSGSIEEGLLLGYYLAEGCLYKDVRQVKGVILTFGIHEDTLAEHAIALFKKVFPGIRISKHVLTDGGVLRIKAVGPGVGQWFERFGGEYSESKRINSTVMGWSVAALTALFAAWVSGDAQFHKKTRRVVGGTVSPYLAAQMQRIAEIAGLRVSLWKETVVGFEKRQQHVGHVTLTVGGAPRIFEVIAKHPAFNLIVSKDSVDAFRKLTPRWREALQTPVRKRDDFAWFEQTRVHTVRFVGRESYVGLVHNIEVEDDNSYVLANGVAVHNCEHVQVPELSKGKIIDAAARDIGDSVYIDILVATEKKHRALIAAIQEKRLTTLSMGCSVSETICTKCGNVATDEPTLCKHVRFEKGNVWYDEFGNKGKVGELCGHISAEPDSVKFIEASWVANPAFTGAVLRSILNPAEAAGMGQRIQVAFSQPTRVADPMLLQRAASAYGGAVSVFPAKFKYHCKTGKTTLGAQEQQFDDGFAAPSSTEAPAAEADKPAAPDPLDKVVDDLTNTIREKVIERVRGEIGKDEGDRIVHNFDENQNDTLIKSALLDPAWRKMASTVLATVKHPVTTKRILLGLMLYKKGGWAKVRQASMFTGADMLALSRFLDIFSQRQALAGDRRLYRVVLAVGGCVKYGSSKRFLVACQKLLGRQLTAVETELLLQKGKLFDQGC